MSNEQFNRLLEQLQGRCLGMAALVEQAVGQAAEAIVRLDPAQAKRVLEGEQRIDDEDVEVERQAINLLSTHHPSAGEFRLVFGIVKINADLERIADCAVNIAQQVGRIPQETSAVPRDARLIAETALKQVQDTVRCLATKEPALADEIRKSDDVVDALNSQIMQELSMEMGRDPASVPANLALIMVAKNFERIGDHCSNIAEDIVYLLRGEIVRHSHERLQG